MNLITVECIEKLDDYEKDQRKDMGLIGRVQKVEVLENDREHEDGVQRMKVWLEDDMNSDELLSFYLYIEAIGWPRLLMNLLKEPGKWIIVCCNYLELIFSELHDGTHRNGVRLLRESRVIGTDCQLFPLAILNNHGDMMDVSRLESVPADIWDGYDSYLQHKHQLGDNYRVKQVISTKPPTWMKTVSSRTSIDQHQDVTQDGPHVNLTDKKVQKSSTRNNEEEEEEDRLLVQLVDQSILSSKPTNHHYEYTKIDQLQMGTEANVYGIVTCFTEPRRTRGTDMVMTLTLVDTFPVTTELKLVLFRPTIEQLPSIQRVGDIMRCHRLKIQKFERNLQGVLTKGFSCFVVDGRMKSKIEPRMPLTNEGKRPILHFGKNDLRHVLDLRQLMEQYGWKSPGDIDSTFLSSTTPIGELVLGSRTNLMAVLVTFLPGASNDLISILISDFTSNDRLMTDIEALEIQYNKWITAILSKYGPKSLLSVMISGEQVARLIGQKLSIGSVIHFKQVFVRPDKYHGFQLVLDSDLYGSSYELIDDNSIEMVIRLKR